MTWLRIRVLKINFDFNIRQTAVVYTDCKCKKHARLKKKKIARGPGGVL